MPLVNEITHDVLVKLAKKRYNVLLTGSHGVGKTTMVKRIATELNIRVKYFSCATLDPWVDFSGVPVPDVKKRVLEFFRPSDVNMAEWLILDEINRCHTKIQNAMLGTTQYKSINGEALPHLKMVWAMQNPPGGKYQVMPLDPAMTTRFQARITLEGAPSADYYEGIGIPRNLGEALVDWWHKDLTVEHREIVDPRTLESLGMLMKDGFNWEFTLGDDLAESGVPLAGLKLRLVNTHINPYEKLALHSIARAPKRYARKAKSDADFAIHVTNECERCRGVTNYEAAPVINALPDEFQTKLLSNPKWVQKMIAAWLKMSAFDQQDQDAQQLHERVKLLEDTFGSHVVQS